MKKIAILLAALVLTIATAGNYYFSATGNLATGYVAKNLCSGVFVSELPAQRILNDAIYPVNPAFTYINFTVDSNTKRVTTDLFGLYRRSAQFRPGLGCTVLPQGKNKLAPVSIKLAENYGPSDDSEILPIANQPSVPGVNHSALTQALDQAFAEDSDLGNKNTNAFVVLQHGKIIAERYAQGVDAQTPLMGWSMSKSITNLLVGILVRENKLNLAAAAPVDEWQKGDARAAITLNNLMQMSSGLTFAEVYTTTSDVAHMLVNENDTGAFAADKVLLHPPGEFWAYSSGTTNIIARIVQQQTGGNIENLYEFTQRELFQPLGIYQAFVEPDPSGVFVGSSYSYLSARDWAKLGQLMLQNGVWKGQRILPEGWTEYSATPTKSNKDNRYGAQFWLNADPDDSSKKRTYPDVPADAYRMAGFQGQTVLIIPSLDLVAVRLGFTPSPVSSGMNEVMRQIIAAL